MIYRTINTDNSRMCKAVRRQRMSDAFCAMSQETSKCKVASTCRNRQGSPTGARSRCGWQAATQSTGNGNMGAKVDGYALLLGTGTVHCASYDQYACVLEPQQKAERYVQRVTTWWRLQIPIGNLQVPPYNENDLQRPVQVVSNQLNYPAATLLPGVAATNSTGTETTYR